MTEILELLKVYKDFGVAGLFITLYLLTVWRFYRELKDREQKGMAMTERMIVALDGAANAIERNGEVLSTVEKSIGESTTQVKLFIAFIRGRDGIKGDS